MNNIVMATLNNDYLPKLKKLYYEDKLSMEAIASSFGVSTDAVSYFMRKHSLVRRTASENEVIKFARKPLSYTLRTPKNESDRNLKIAGAILYWAEGYKTEKSKGIDFANADPMMVKVFVRFLREICGVDSRKMRVLLYCYSNQNVEKLIDFWSKMTRIPRSQFTKPYVRKDFREEQKGKMRYGMVHIRYSDKKLLAQVMQWIQEFKEKNCVGTQVVNEDTL